MIRRRRHSGPAVRLAQLSPLARLALLVGYPHADGRPRYGLPWRTASERVEVYRLVRVELLRSPLAAAVGAPAAEYDLRVAAGIEPADDFHGWRECVGGDVAALAAWQPPPDRSTP